MNPEEEDYLAPIDPDAPCKSIEELVAEGKISPENFRSFLFLMQAGVGFSSSPKDAIFIEKKIAELNDQIEKNKEGKA